MHIQDQQLQHSPISSWIVHNGSDTSFPPSSKFLLQLADKVSCAIISFGYFCQGLVLVWTKCMAMCVWLVEIKKD
ncbi:hypothetical protein Ocin01_05063 [Orchesella cincta]|uniref:Uncharacterized protein n=1 Tax=Orchesella cincta TaxID=48709 RepID=A0A1D2N8N5_ORCCI|nr:hypothetical protein Ocin01_05063 [Orchesella cincta]